MPRSSCLHCEELREQIRELERERRELFSGDIGPIVLGLPAEPMVARLILTLYRANGRLLSDLVVQDDLWPRSVAPSKCLDAAVMKARRALGGRGMLDRVRSTGVGLTAAGMAKVRSLLTAKPEAR